MSTTLKLKTKQIYEAKSLFEKIKDAKLFPSFVANNLVTLQLETDKLGKENKLLVDSFSIENGTDQQGNKTYKQFLYVSVDNGQTIRPFLKEEKEVEFTEEAVKEIEENYTEDDKKSFEIFNVKPLFIPYPVEPSRFEEYVTENNDLMSKEVEISYIQLKNEVVEKAELDGKLDVENATEYLIQLKLFGYYA